MLTAFYVTKALLALGATLLLIFHMEQVWRESLTTARRGRYLILLWIGGSLTYVSVQQFHETPPLDLRAWLGMATAILLAIVAAMSVLESRAEKH